MTPSLILFFNIIAWAWVAYSTAGLLIMLAVASYYRKRGVRPTLTLHWWTVPMLVLAAAWLSVFSGLSFG